MAAKTATKTATKTAKKHTRQNPARKLTAAQIDVLGVLHENDKWHTVETVVAESGMAEKAAKAVLSKLVELGLAIAHESGDKFRYTGLRCKALKLAVGAMRLMGAPTGAGIIGASIWGDPKAKNDPKAETRYMAAAYAVLKTAFELGAVYRMDGGDGAPTFGAVA